MIHIVILGRHVGGRSPGVNEIQLQTVDPEVVNEFFVRSRYVIAQLLVPDVVDARTHPVDVERHFILEPPVILCREPCERHREPHHQLHAEAVYVVNELFEIREFIQGNVPVAALIVVAGVLALELPPVVKDDRSESHFRRDLQFFRQQLLLGFLVEIVPARIQRYPRILGNRDQLFKEASHPVARLSHGVVILKRPLIDPKNDLMVRLLKEAVVNDLDLEQYLVPLVQVVNAGTDLRPFYRVGQCGGDDVFVFVVVNAHHRRPRLEDRLLCIREPPLSERMVASSHRVPRSHHAFQLFDPGIITYARYPVIFDAAFLSKRLQLSIVVKALDHILFLSVHALSVLSF